jgi:hypothetical protein
MLTLPRSLVLGVVVGSGVASACGGGAQHAAAEGSGGGASSGSASSSASTTSSGSVASSGSTSSSGGWGGSGGSVTGVTGGKLDSLEFAIVGDTRPPNEDDVAGYPTAVITKLWQQVAAFSPLPPFAITTGDYQFSNPNGAMATPQLDLYVTARSAFSNVVFPAMGNHECTGATASNCGAGNTDGITANYTAFTSKLLAPIAVTLPYFTATIGSTTGAWTAKFVIIAANAWDTTQETWLATELAKPTTYTFIVRHESVSANTAPGVTPSEAVIAKYPYTLAIIGHSHEYRYDAQTREIIVGNGGAPLSGGSNYGYVIARQRTDMTIVFTSYEYETNAVVQTFALNPDGTAAP